MAAPPPHRTYAGEGRNLLRPPDQGGSRSCATYRLVGAPTRPVGPAHNVPAPPSARGVHTPPPPTPPPSHAAHTNGRAATCCGPLPCKETPKFFPHRNLIHVTTMKRGIGRNKLRPSRQAPPVRAHRVLGSFGRHAPRRRGYFARRARRETACAGSVRRQHAPGPGWIAPLCWTHWAGQD